MKAILMFLFLSLSLFAEDIYLKNGTIYLNAKIIERNETFITITVNEGKTNILLVDIEKIVDTPYNPNITGTVKQGKVSFNVLEKTEDKNTLKISQKHFLVVTVLAGLVAWDSFSEASKLPKGDDKTRKIIIGTVSILASAVSLAISLDTIKITLDKNELNVSYNF